MAGSKMSMSQDAAYRAAAATPGQSFGQRPYASMEPSSPLSSITSPSPSIGFTAAKPQFHRVQSALASDSVHEVERNASIASLIVDQLLDTLKASADGTNVSQWVKALSDLKAQVRPAQTIIGVVGNTGAGKSSVINAVLEEERLVPTNCFRACTAVITELSYNTSQDPDQLYRAEVEFIAPEDWTNELTLLKDDLIDGRGQVSKDSVNADSEAGVAWAKIQAVYPNLKKEDLLTTHLDTLTNDPQVTGVLGTTKHIAEPEIERFYSCLQHYIDSKHQGKPLRRGRRKKDSKERSLEYWPLVKVVRVYTKADALSTGAKIVDLPGVQDSNEARAAVAQRYIENCSGLWIVAPISRAVSDKTAQHLLGAAFKLQLKYDSSFTNLTFIASKADDISISEAIRDLEPLGGSDDYEALFKQFDDLTEREQSKKEELDELELGLESAEASLEEIDDKLAKWQKLAVRQEKGQTVFTAQILPQKRSVPREIAALEIPTWKRSRLDTVRRGHGPERGYVEHSDYDSDSDGSDVSSGAETAEKPLSREQVQSKVDEYEAARTEALGHVSQYEAATAPARAEHHDLQKELSRIQFDVKAICIRSRNEQSREAIRQDFARGVRESDQESVDEVEFDPDDELRDYAKVAASLPVFCVSSIAHQTLSGRFRKDGPTPGFYNLEETEISQLQAHAVRMTESTRFEAAQKFLNHFSHLLNSLAIWARTQKSQYQATEREKKTEMAYIRDASAQLLQNLVKISNDTVRECEENFAKQLFRTFAPAAKKATAKAVETTEAWGKDRRDGGLAYHTYRATCGRNGAFRGASGYRNFNEELLQPLKSTLANNWEKVFARTIPQSLAQFSTDVQKSMQQWHNRHQTRLQSKSCHDEIAVLDAQIPARRRIIKDMVSDFNRRFTALKRSANREFTPVVVEALAKAYGECAAERGIGSFMRIKEVMRKHIAKESKTMFRDSCMKVKERLLDFCNEIRQDMHSKTDEVVVAMAADYHTAVIGRELSHASKNVRIQTQKLLSKVDTSFETGQVDAMSRENLRPKAGPSGSSQAKSLSSDAGTIKVELGNHWFHGGQSSASRALPTDQSLQQQQALPTNSTPTNSPVRGMIFPNLPRAEN